MTSQESAPSTPPQPKRRGFLWQVLRFALLIAALLLGLILLLWLSPSLRGRALAQIVWRGGSDTRSFFVMRIEELGEPGVGSLIKLLAHDDFELRLKVVDSLGVIGPDAQAAIPVMTKLLDADPDASVRRRAAWAIARVGSSSACEALAQRLPEKLSKDEALAAIEGLSKAPAPALLSVLLKKLTDEPKDEAQRNELWDLRCAVCERLKIWRLNSQEVLAALKTAAEGQDPDVAEAARASLADLTSPPKADAP